MRNRISFAVVIIALCALATTACMAADGGLQAPRHDFPRVGPYEVITGDFHMHTIFSDGRLTPRQRVEEAYKWGFDAIAITDHGHTDAYRVASYVGQPLGMVVIRGFETGVAKKEHLVVLNVPADYKPRDAHNWAEKSGEAKAFYQDELNGISKAGGIVIYAHPHVGYRDPVLWGIGKGIIKGIEIKNGAVGAGWNTVKDHGANWYPSAFDFAIQHNLAMVADSDLHGDRTTDASPVTLLMVTQRSADGVTDAIKNGRTAAWFSGMLWGREKLLNDLITSSVKVRKTGSNRIEIENLCPVALSGVVQGASEKLELPAYGKASIDAGAAKTIKIEWSNVWTSLQSNLTTELTPGP